MTKPFELKLELDWKPGAFHHHTVRKTISTNLWRKIRQQVLKDKNNTCSICGYSPKDGSELKRLHVHEGEEYSDDYICTLKDLDLICDKCHSFYHWGRTVSVLSKEQVENLIEHFIKVNQCSKDDFQKYYKMVSLRKHNIMMEYLKQPIKAQDLPKKVTVKFKIDCEVPYKNKVIEQLKKKGLYIENL